jgi:hypothetical protein
MFTTRIPTSGAIHPTGLAIADLDVEDTPI